MEAGPWLERRQLWANPNPTANIPIRCRAIKLPSGGLLNLGNNTVITLSTDAVYEPACTDFPDLNITSPGFNVSVADDRDPFYASTLPQIYAIATATIISYMLLIILFITPRTFFVGGAGGGNGFLGRRGMISGASGSTSVIGIGSRPWLQKVAALTVAVSLTIATIDTLRIAELQYDAGYQDVNALTEKVADNLEIRVVRVISDTCLWLAQAQTLIRLFPRHREKVIIKWTAFALILLDFIFSILNGFVYGNARTRPRTFVDTVPALNYLFAIALSILYTAWVLYYAISKRRFAFYHPKMRNICLMAILSLAAILIPVVFFVLDIASPELSSWGNYVRWVGAAAASVVVWEWVERIEALERDENKDGILGREIFDGDEMLRDTPLGNDDWRARSRDNGGGGTRPPRGPSGGNEIRGGGRNPRSRGGVTSAWANFAAIADPFKRKTSPERRNRYPRQALRGFRSHRRRTQASTTSRPASKVLGQETTPTPVTVSPVSRTDTTSAASTVYRAHYHPVSEATPPIQEAPARLESNNFQTVGASPENNAPHREDSEIETGPSHRTSSARPQHSAYSWRRVPNPFKRQRASPPPEVSQAMATIRQNTSVTKQNNAPATESSQGRRFNTLWPKPRSKREETPLPVTVIPWQPRGRAYLETVTDDSPQTSTRPESVIHTESLPTDGGAPLPRGPNSPLRDPDGSRSNVEDTATT